MPLIDGAFSGRGNGQERVIPLKVTNYPRLPTVDLREKALPLRKTGFSIEVVKAFRHHKLHPGLGYPL